MKNLFVFIICLFASTVALAGACYEQEINFKTGKIFASYDEYQSELQRWEEKAPSTPSYYSLMKAYLLYKNDKDFALKIKNDKVAHCFMGCRISQYTDYHTADYVGWLKEKKDLKDCNINTHYDEYDYVATVRGAQIGENSSASCLSSCKQIYNNFKKNLAVKGK
ncbi:MAG: hypothetical protein ACXVCP_16000 [Bdellovibrio sp.]